MKVALGQGELDEMSCAEKLDCVTSALRSRENAALMEMLMKHLRFDQFRHMYDFASYDFQSLHTHCLKKSLASPGRNKTKNGRQKMEEMRQKIKNLPRVDMYLTQDCTGNTGRIAQINQAMQDAKNIGKLAKEMVERRSIAEEEKGKEDDRKMKEAKTEEKRKLEEKQQLEKEASEKRQRGKSAKKRRNKEKKRKEVENTAVVKSKTDEASGEKVKVKASLRSTISELEMEEERAKLAIASAMEEENNSSLALESRLKIVQEEQEHLQEEIRDVEAALESLLKRKVKIIEQEEEAGREVKELEERRKDSKKLTATKVNDWMEKIENVQEKLKVVHQELQLVEARGRGGVNSELERFMERQMEELREELECPVCLEVTTKAPIYKCSDDHIVCRYFFAV